MKKKQKRKSNNTEKVRYKIFTIDNFLSTATIFAFLFFLPIIFTLDFLDPIQNTFQDFYLTDVIFSKVRKQRDVNVDSNIILVNIGNLDRKGIAKQIEIINRYKPKVLGIDSFFRHEKDSLTDYFLEKTISDCKNVVMVSQIYYNNKNQQFDSIAFSHSKFTKHTYTGFANLISDSIQMRTIRQFSPVEKVINLKKTGLKTKYDSTFPQNEYFFAVKVAELFSPNDVDKILNRNNPKEIINYRRNYDKYLTLDADDVFIKQDSLGFIKNKIVLMGYMGPDLKTIVNEDNFFTPLNSQYVGRTFPDMYGVVIHANVISMILENSFYNSMPEYLSYISVIIIIFLFNVYLFYLKFKYPHLYEPLSILSIFILMLLIALVVLAAFNYFSFEINIRWAFFVILISVPGFEAYHDSFKPLVVRAFVKYNIKKWERREKKSKKDD